jgi:hypothetical protein
MERAVMATIVDAQAGRDTPEAYVETFEALLADADTKGFLKLLGIGRFSFLEKRRMERVFMALCAGMWKLALSHAVPERSAQAYETWLAARMRNVRDADVFREFLAGIACSLPESSGADFMPASRDLFARAGKESDQASLMGMALYLRRLYEYFFNHIL